MNERQAKILRGTARGMTTGMPLCRYTLHKRYGHAILIVSCTRSVYKRLKATYKAWMRGQRVSTHS